MAIFNSYVSLPEGMWKFPQKTSFLDLGLCSVRKGFPSGWTSFGGCHFLRSITTSKLSRSRRIYWGFTGAYGRIITWQWATSFIHPLPFFGGLTSHASMGVEPTNEWVHKSIYNSGCLGIYVLGHLLDLRGKSSQSCLAYPPPRLICNTKRYQKILEPQIFLQPHPKNLKSACKILI